MSEGREKRDFSPTSILTLLLGKKKAGQNRQLHIMDFIPVNSFGAMSQPVGAAGRSSCWHQGYENRLWVSFSALGSRGCSRAAGRR